MDVAHPPMFGAAGNLAFALPTGIQVWRIPGSLVLAPLAGRQERRCRDHPNSHNHAQRLTFGILACLQWINRPRKPSDV
jgi:hypothetical protein